MLAGLRRDGLGVPSPTVLSIQGQPPLRFQPPARAFDGHGGKVSAIWVKASVLTTSTDQAFFLAAVATTLIGYLKDVGQWTATWRLG
jgi:hypothetical protein